MSHGPEMADAAVDGERPPQPPAEDAEHADDVPGAEAPFDFAAMRPAGALAKVARHEMFAQPPNKCQLGCCKLNSDFSENNAKWTGKEELGENRRERTGLELEQVQLTEQRLFYRRILMDLTPLEAKTMTTFGGNDLSASILYPQISVGAQLMQRIDYAGFVGASKEQLDTLRMGATKIHPRTLPTLQPGHGRGPHKYNHVNFNIAHLKLTPSEFVFAEDGTAVAGKKGVGQKQKRGLTTALGEFQKTVCCLTCGQIVSDKKDATGTDLADDDAVKVAFEKVQFYSVLGVAKQAFGYDEMKDELRDFYDDAVKVDSPYTTETALRTFAKGLWQKSKAYNKSFVNKKYDLEHQATTSAAAAAAQATEQADRLRTRDCTRLREMAKRTIAALEMDSVAAMEDKDQATMLRWHSVLCNTTEGTRMAGGRIKKGGSSTNKKARAEAIHSDLVTMCKLSGRASDSDDSDDSDDNETNG